MESSRHLHLQDIIFTRETSSRQISNWEKAGLVKKIAPRIYTGKVEEAPETLIRRNLFSILGHQYPNAIISYRSAFELKPTATDDFFLTYTYTRKIVLPGLNLHILKGKGPIAGDRLFVGALYLGQQARTFLENLQVSRRSGSHSKTLPRAVVEEKLESIIRVNGESAINELRNQARKIAPELFMERAFERLDQIISALLTTHNSKILQSPAAKARAMGMPFDVGRIQLFERLFIALQQRTLKSRPDKNKSALAFHNFAFFESYFSNYIEGTIFKVMEAREIIETQQPLPARNEDSHDILGTYNIVSSRREMKIVPSSGEQLLEILKYRHQILLSARRDKQPGQFKQLDNFAGNTSFVAHELVKGTLIEGFGFYRALHSPIAKALFIMFMISEVHPFLDGNGRTARVMMNAELVSSGEAKIMIPTVYRDDYIDALRRLTRRSDPDAYIRMMLRAHEFSSNVYGDDRAEMEAYLYKCNAFMEETEGQILRIAPREE